MRDPELVFQDEQLSALVRAILRETADGCPNGKGRINDRVTGCQHPAAHLTRSQGLDHGYTADDKETVKESGDE